MLRSLGVASIIASCFIVPPVLAADWSFYTPENGVVDLNTVNGAVSGTYSGFTKQGARFQVPIVGENTTDGILQLDFDFGGHKRSVELRKTGAYDGYRTWVVTSGAMPSGETEMSAPIFVETDSAADLTRRWEQARQASYPFEKYQVYLREKADLLKEAFGEAYSAEAFSTTVGVIDHRRNYSRWQVAAKLALDKTAGIKTLGTASDIAMISVPDTLLTNGLTPTIFRNSGLPMEPPPSIFPQSTKTARIPVSNVFHTLYSNGVLGPGDTNEFMSLFVGRDCKMHPPRSTVVAATCTYHSDTFKYSRNEHLWIKTMVSFRLGPSLQNNKLQVVYIESDTLAASGASDDSPMADRYNSEYVTSPTATFCISAFEREINSNIVLKYPTTTMEE
ncbi:hypothetical protein SAMN03159496_03885 [Rhizobium sp. NFR07]|uniref:hypothetical protein n=1 Tax=Rhizobium sp. NFR07 TaxID=1566262 RepID=UPI0008E9C2AB|nr:hypothetical protein [Rhizobium sp. NFR07]SFB45722.1 hypothetical protein SAMN03159496_03885 [Rhizobium sp. NFR07]